MLSRHWSRLNFYEIQDLPLFLSRFWALKKECSELHDWWKGKKRPKRKVKMEFRREKSPNQILVRKVYTTWFYQPFLEGFKPIAKTADIWYSSVSRSWTGLLRSILISGMKMQAKTWWQRYSWTIGGTPTGPADDALSVASWCVKVWCRHQDSFKAQICLKNKGKSWFSSKFRRLHSQRIPLCNLSILSVSPK